MEKNLRLKVLMEFAMFSLTVAISGVLIVKISRSVAPLPKPVGMVSVYWLKR